MKYQLSWNQLEIDAVREKPHILYFIPFRFVFFFILSFFLFFHYYMELAWQQMNANEQNDFRIVSVNLYTIKNNLALNQL